MNPEDDRSSYPWDEDCERKVKLPEEDTAGDYPRPDVIWPLDVCKCLTVECVC